MIAEAKRALRDTLRARRRDAARAGGAEAAGALAERALGWLAARAIDTRAVVAGYVAMADEIDPAPLLDALAGQGHPLCLPVVVTRGEALLFRRFRSGEALVPGPFGIPAPPETAAAMIPDILLVPLLGFDRNGARLGQGGGFYDRSLAGLRRENPALLAIGLAFSVQEVASVPRALTDAAVDLVVTERAVIEVS